MSSLAAAAAAANWFLVVAVVAAAGRRLSGGCCCCYCWQLLRLVPRRVERFQGCNVLECEFWHVRRLDQKSALCVSYRFYGVFLRIKTCSTSGLCCAKTRVFAHGSLDFYGYLQSSVASPFPFSVCKSGASCCSSCCCRCCCWWWVRLP